MKLLLIGPGSVHLFNYYELISGYFEDTLIISDHIPGTFRHPGCIKADFSISDPLKAMNNFLFLKRQIRLYCPDIIHVHQADTAAYMAIRAVQKERTPVVVTAWGSDILATPHKGILYMKMVQYILQKASRLTADSHYLAAEMQKLAGKVKEEITVVNFGVDPLINDCLKENLVYSNRMHEPIYNIDKIIRAFALFVKLRPENWKLVIAGSGSQTDVLKKLTADLDLNEQVTFTGWLDPASNQQYYKKSRIFISIPSSDGTAVSLLEAMSAGCIPVVSDLPSNREWIQNDVNGIIIKDMESDIILPALNLDPFIVAEYNLNMIREKAGKERSRSVFAGIYKSLL